MDRNFKRALPLVLKHEGGWADHPEDPGGATMKGVTLATFRRYVKADATKSDLRAISDDQIATVYYRHYWSAVNAPALPSGLDYAVFDFAVNSGPSRAAKYIQRIVGVKQDGRIGPATIAAVGEHDAADLINRLCDARMAFLKALKTWPTFGKGWSRRVDDVRRAALRMVGNPADVERVNVPVPVPKPIVPEAVDKAVQKTTQQGGWLSGIGAAIGAGLSAVLGADWQTVAVIGGVGLAGIVLALAAGPVIVSRIKAIRTAVEADR